MLNPVPSPKLQGSFRLAMAPMAGITDIVFRRLIREMGAEVVISELVSAEGLVRGGEKSRELMQYCEQERPVGIQIFGSSPESLANAAHYVQEEGADFVDINFGCPVKKVVCDGSGAAWLKNPEAMGDLLTQIKSKLKIPLTIKVRTGWDENSINLERVVQVASQVGIHWVSIHGRTRAQGYSGESNWNLIREVAQKNFLPIFGNGDIVTAEKGLELLEQGYSHGIMIGRGALKNPWIFEEILKKPGIDYDFPKLIERHFELALEHKGRKRAFLSLKKFFAWYAAGFPGASLFRASLFQTNDVEELKKLALDFFSGHRSRPQNDGQPFLMGGHG